MIVYHNIETYKISWLRTSYNPKDSHGIINRYYIPETIEECVDIIKQLNAVNLFYRIIGHTSNIYILPETNIANVVSTRKLCKWHEKDAYIICECGVNVKRLSRNMTERGIKGFSGLIDLPGTIGAAIYGNSSVGNYSIINILEDVTILQGTELKTISATELKPTFRSTALKRGELKGFIVSCRLRKCLGNKDEIIKEREYYHNWRKQNQPGPLNNLGTTMLINDKTLLGILISLYANLNSFFYKTSDSSSYKLKTALALLNMDIRIADYMFGYNRYIWKDFDAHRYFPEYYKFIRKIFVNPKFEIEIW